jgi:hypothetical protein
MIKTRFALAVALSIAGIGVSSNVSAAVTPTIQTTSKIEASAPALENVRVVHRRHRAVRHYRYRRRYVHHRYYYRHYHRLWVPLPFGL